jgi:hypothetical protein
VRAGARIGTEHVISSSKSKTSKTTTEPAAAFLAEAAQREQTYAEASALHRQDERDHAAAVAQVEAVKRDRASQPEDLSLALAAVALAEGRKAESASALAKAERARISTDTSLAAVLVPFVASVVGITPTVQAFRPSEVPTELPSAVLVQTKPSKHDRRSGRLSGEVHLHFTRTRLHRGAEAGAFQRAAERSDLGVTLSGGTTGHTEDSGDVLVDIVRLPVFGALPEVPEVTVTDPRAVAHEVAVEVVYRVGKATGYTADPSMPRTGLDTGRRVAVQAEPISARVLSDKCRGDVRTLVVEATVKAKAGRYLTPDMREHYSVTRCGVEVAAAVDSVAGRALAKVGRVSEATVTGTDVEDGPSGVPVAAVVTMRAVVLAKVPAIVELAYGDEDRRAGDPRDLDPLALHPGAL